MSSYAAHASYMQVCTMASARATIGGPSVERRTASSATLFHSSTTFSWCRRRALRSRFSGGRGREGRPVRHDCNGQAYRKAGTGGAGHRRPPPAAVTGGWMFWFTRNRFAASVLGFDLCKPAVVVAVARFDAAGPFVHHEVDVRAAEVERMDRLPIRLGPTFQGVGASGFGIDRGDDHRPGGITRVPGRGVRGDASDRAVDRIEMHERQLARRVAGVGDVHVDRVIR